MNDEDGVLIFLNPVPVNNSQTIPFIENYIHVFLRTLNKLKIIGGVADTRCNGSTADQKILKAFTASSMTIDELFLG